MLTNRVAYYRCALPVLPANPNGSHTGRWHALLRLARKNPGPFIYDVRIRATNQGLVIPYEFVAHTYSTLTFAAHVSQNSFEPGAVAEVSASLLEYAALPTGRARVWAEVQKPGGMGADVVSLALGAADRYVVSYPMPTPGLYTFRVRARGETMYGMPFEREQTLTAVAVPGGDQWSPNDPPRDVLCELLDCIRRSGAISGETLRRLEALGFNVGEVLKCLDRQCRTSREG